MKKKLLFPFCLAVLIALGGCAGPKGIDITGFGLADASLSADLGVLPQDLTVYAERAGRDTLLMSPDRQGREDARFNERFFAAWDANIPLLPKDAVFEAVKNMNPARGFAENLRPYAPERWERLVANTFMEAYGTSPVRHAITVRTAHLRRMPTDAPFFLNPGRAGEGFPFDYMQNSALWIGTPAAITHVSRDGMWVFVQTSLVSGWAKVTDLASVDRPFMETWRSRPLAVVVRDGTCIMMAGKPESLTGRAGAAEAFIGTVLPLAETSVETPVAMSSQQSAQVAVHVPLRNADGEAVLGTGFFPMADARQKPLPLTPMNVALVGNGMVGQPYGWGGLFGQRDCSAAMHDLFAPFGIWLPRNSLTQGRLGVRVPLTELNPDEKEQRITRDGVPFFSLVSMPGHVGLYLGSYPVPGSGGKDREVPVMFHNLWGIRVTTGSGDDKRDGRGIIGKAVVTTLRPGAEHAIISSPASMLDRIAGLALLPEPFPDERRDRR